MFLLLFKTLRYADDRSLCCLLAEGSNVECVVAKPQSAFFTCNRLLPRKAMVGFIWFQAIAAVFGNLAVIGWRKQHFKEGKGKNKLTMNIMSINNQSLNYYHL